MSYYTERHGMRAPVEKTSVIDPDVYSLLLKCCEKYYNNIAWKYPEFCPDGCGCCGLDIEQFEIHLKYEIPTLFRDSRDHIVTPAIHHDFFNMKSSWDEYDQFALLDYIEFFAQNCRDVIIGDFHGFFGHYHLTLKKTNQVFRRFQREINSIFEITGLLFNLSDEQIVERVIENTPLTPQMEQQISQIDEKGARELLQEAISLHKQHHPNSARDAVEKIWDALERLKSYYTTMNKKDSAAKIVEDMANGNSSYIKLFNDEFLALTTIGNNYRIRHHETDRVEITDIRHYDYFFNRCLSLIVLAIQYLR